MNTQDLQTIHGYVMALPPRRASDLEPVRVAVVTDDGAEYHVLHKGTGAGLADNISAGVEVTGRVRPPAASAPDAAPDPEAPGLPVFLFYVYSYKLIDGYDNPWYDDTVE